MTCRRLRNRPVLCSKRPPHDELTAFGNLIFSIQFYGIPRDECARRAEELPARFRLADKRDTPFGKLSRGMKYTLTIAAKST
jgi:ABC-type multidrug transport system ATPase subunit